MKPLKLYQGSDESLVITSNIDLSAATEIEVTIDTPTQIVKTLSGGSITATTTTFTIAIDAADTATVAPGTFKYQARATIGGKKKQGRFTPNSILILPSVFESTSNVTDYG
jgi:hypothetical protein